MDVVVVTLNASATYRGRDGAKDQLEALPTKSRARLEAECLKLEPISKSFEEDDEAGKLDKAEEIVGVVLPGMRIRRCH